MSLEKLISGDKLPVLFIGSGFSRRYLDAPIWKDLLIKVLEYIGEDSNEYKRLRSKVIFQSDNRDLSESEIDAKVATEIEKIFNNHFYENEEFSKKFSSWIDDEVNPFKKCISVILNSFCILPEKNEEIEEFKHLKNKTISVITTNYDALIEDLFNLEAENIFIGQPQLFNPKSVEIGELYKIHGCITRPNDIVMTVADYENFKINAKLFSAKLLTLICENPVVFIGYSINDPNIHQILNDLVGCLASEQIEELQNHFYLVDFKAGESGLIEKEYRFEARAYNGNKASFPISMITTDNYLEVYKLLNKLTPAMNINTVKQVKRILRDIVIESTQTNSIKDPILTVLVDDISKLSETDQKFAVAIGNVKDIAGYGYAIRPIGEIIEDVLFGNKNLNSYRLITETYECSYLRATRIVPIYKYLNNPNNDLLNSCPRTKTYVENHQNVGDYLNASLKQAIRNIPVSSNWDDIPPTDKAHPRRENLWILKNCEHVPIEKLRQYLCKEFGQYDTFTRNKKSEFHRLVSIYDFLKYKKENV